MQVTDDLFDEIAQEVMDEDEQRLLEGLVSLIALKLCQLSSLNSFDFVILCIVG